MDRPDNDVHPFQFDKSLADTLANQVKTKTTLKVRIRNDLPLRSGFDVSPQGSSAYISSL